MPLSVALRANAMDMWQQLPTADGFTFEELNDRSRLTSTLANRDQLT